MRIDLVPELTLLLRGLERRYGRLTPAQWRDQAAAEEDPIIRRLIVRRATAAQFGEDLRDWPVLPDASAERH